MVYWEIDVAGVRRVLTDEGVAYVRNAVRQERLASLEIWFRLGALVVGVAIAVSTTISILK